MGQQKVCI